MLLTVIVDKSVDKLKRVGIKFEVQKLKIFIELEMKGSVDVYQIFEWG